MTSSSDASAETAPSAPGDRPADPARPVAQHIAQVLGETARAACGRSARRRRVLERALTSPQFIGGLFVHALRDVITTHG